jgi:hypothetical protein
VVEGPAGLVVDAAMSRYIPLLPLLYWKPDDVARALQRALTSQGLPSELRRHFPWQGIVATAVASPGRGWTDFALDWITELHLAGQFKDQLGAIATDRRVSQQTRHKARRLANSVASVTTD